MVPRAWSKRTHHVHNGKQSNECVHVKGQLLSLLIKSRIPCLGKLPLRIKMSLPTSSNLTKITPHRHPPGESRFCRPHWVKILAIHLSKLIIFDDNILTVSLCCSFLILNWKLIFATRCFSISSAECDRSCTLFSAWAQLARPSGPGAGCFHPWWTAAPSTGLSRLVTPRTPLREDKFACLGLWHCLNTA